MVKLTKFKVQVSTET